MSSTAIIYALCEPGTDTIRYIGRTLNLVRRFNEHLKISVHSKTHLGCWIRGIVSRGVVPSVQILCRCAASESAKEEIRCIREAKTSGMDLVNGTCGGDGVEQTPEVREKIRQSKRGKPIHPNTRAAACRPHSSERRERFRLLCLGRKCSPETRQKLREKNLGENNPNWGKSPSRETRDKISLAGRGRNPSLETRQKMRLAKLGKIRGPYRRRNR